MHEAPPAVLVVDDDVLIANTLRLQLRRVLPPGWEVITALSGPEALDHAQEHVAQGGRIPLALVDYQMYPMKGSDLLLVLVERYPGLRTIMLTGQADMEAVNMVINKVHLYRYIQKPWDPQDLERTVLEAINEAEQASGQG
jgi:DNA-binding NtrC family response regulator